LSVPEIWVDGRQELPAEDVRAVTSPPEIDGDLKPASEATVPLHEYVDGDLTSMNGLKWLSTALPNWVFKYGDEVDLSDVQRQSLEAVADELRTMDSDVYDSNPKFSTLHSAVRDLLGRS
jgi:hypothetical protein